MKRHATLETVRFVEELLAHGLSHAKAARRVGLSEVTVWTIANGKHFQQCPERRAKHAAREAMATDPTPEEIAERCAEIRRRRHGEQVERYSFPMLAQL